MSDRLHELRCQRERVAQHLAQLDAEIAALAGQVLPPASGTAESRAQGDPLAVETAALAQARLESAETTRRAKLGCWILFGAALGGLLAAVGIWFVTR